MLDKKIKVLVVDDAIVYRKAVSGILAVMDRVEVVRMPMLPGDLEVPIDIVLHLPPVSTRSLANSLNAKCSLTVMVAEEGEILQANAAYLALVANR